MPKVSIIVPVYGVEKYIERCAVSLFDQTYEDIEYIFVNDCTKDNSIVILKEVIERYPTRKPHVRIIEHEKNKGLGGARNTAVAAATGDFLIHVDSDDYIDVLTLQKLVEAQTKSNADIIAFGGYSVYTNKLVEEREFVCQDRELSIINMIKHTTRNSVWGRLIRKQLYTDNNINVLPGTNMSEDLQVVPRLYYYANKVEVLDELLYYYNCLNEGSYTYSFSEKKAKQVFQTLDILEEFFKEQNPKIKEAINERRYGCYLSFLTNSCKEKDHKKFYNEAITVLSNHGNKYIADYPLARKIPYLIKQY